MSNQHHTDLLLLAMNKIEEAMKMLGTIVRERQVAEDPSIDFLDRKISDVDWGTNAKARVSRLNANEVHSYNKEGKYVRVQIETVRDLTTVCERDLLMTMNTGRVTVNAIKGVLSAHGLMLSKPNPPAPWVSDPELEASP